jgi:DNA-binding IclR family transcriptional regulator
MLACLPPSVLESFLEEVVIVPFTERTIRSRAELRVELERVRASGFAICDEEHEVGVSCIAAAIRNRHGDPVAAISLSGPTARMVPHLAEGSESVGKIREVAGTLSARFGRNA